MYWETCEITKFEIYNHKFVRFSGKEVRSGSPYWVYLSENMFEDLKSGKPFNLCLSKCDFTTKNFLATGEGAFTSSPFVFMRQLKRKVFITNAVAHSVAYYAWVYINHHYEVKDNEWIGKDIDYIEDKFLKQSKKFLILYKDIFEKIDELLPKFTNEELDKYFKDINIVNVKKRFRRQVYHTHLECEKIRSNYCEGDKYYNNTGVFYENDLLDGTHVYSLDEVYLQELGMRECKICQNMQ